MSSSNQRFNNATNKLACSYRENCYRKKESHFIEFDHPHLNRLLSNTGLTVPPDYHLKTSKQTLQLQLQIVYNLRKESADEGNPSASDSDNSSKASQHDKNDTDVAHPISLSQSSSQQISAKSKVNANAKELMEKAKCFADSLKKKICISIADKWNASQPYNIFYTGLDSSVYKKDDRLSIIFSELLDPFLGDLESSLLINFMVEFGWVLACYATTGHRLKPMTLIYGEIDVDLSEKFLSFLTAEKIKPPSPFGSHHTKMMIFSYVDGSIRVVVCTANLVESDWTNKTQGIWISPKCELMSEESDSSNKGDSPTHFKRDLLRYLNFYNLPSLKPWIDKVTKADMSHIKVFFVSSVPGTHGPNNAWGQYAVRSLLRHYAPAPLGNTYEVIAQCSSIGSMGAKEEDFLCGEFLETMSTNNISNRALPSISLIYPSFKDVEASADGLLSGGCLPYSSKTHSKQEWLNSYLRRWKSDNICRTKAVPHIKSYARISPDHKRISFFLLTSANMSRAAWGKMSKKSTINILSYEAGVLFLPQFMSDSDYFPLTDEEVPFSNPLPKFTLPYDVPLTNYNYNDIPWFIDNLPM